MIEILVILKEASEELNNTVKHFAFKEIQILRVKLLNCK